MEDKDKVIKEKQLNDVAGGDGGRFNPPPFRIKVVCEKCGSTNVKLSPRMREMSKATCNDCGATFTVKL